jgi:multidrug efflux system outer membrane protein
MSKPALLIPLLAAACAAPLPVVQDPLPSLEPAWNAPEASGAFDLLSALGSAELVGLVDEALASSPDLAGAVARLDAAEALLGISQGPLLPSIGADLQNSRSQINLAARGIPVPNPIRTFGAWNGSFAASWEVDLWGRIRAGVRAAEADLAASSADLEAARVSLAGQVVRAWLILGEARAQRELAERTLESWRQSERQVAQRFEAGLGRALDLRLLRTSVASAVAILEGAREGEALAERALEALLGGVADGSRALEGALPSAPPESPSGVPVAVLGHRPDLRGAARRTAAELARAEVSRAELWPRISFTASSGWNGTKAEDIGDPDFSVWSFVGGLSAPLFQGGALRARVRAADARVRGAVAAWEGLVLRACAEVERARVRSEAADRRHAALEEAAREAEGAETLAQEQYEAGLVGIVEVLESQRRRLSIEAQVLGSQRARHEARVDLWLALGGHGVAASRRGDLADPDVLGPHDAASGASDALDVRP